MDDSKSSHLSWISKAHKLVLAAAHFSDASVAFSPFHQDEQIRQSSVAKLSGSKSGWGKKQQLERAVEHSWIVELMDAASQRCSDPCSSSSSSFSDVKLRNVFRILPFDGFHKLIPGQ